MELPDKKSGFNWSSLWPILLFAAGSFFNAGMGWGGSTKDISNIQASVARIEGAVNTLTTSDRTTYGEMQAMENHLRNTDQQVIELKTSLEEIRNRLK